MTQQAINEAEWADRSNWTWGVYRSPRDTRVWVPKPVRWMGWTLNFAHPQAYAWLAALLTPALLVLVAVFAAT